jgi:uncharacterized Zn-finger protein
MKKLLKRFACFLFGHPRELMHLSDDNNTVVCDYCGKSWSLKK